MKAVLGRHFSLTVFGFAQVAMDLGPLVRMLPGDAVVHGLSHTYLGATGIGLLSLLVGRPLGCRLLGLRPPGRGAPFPDWLRGPGVISWPAAMTGAFVGTYSHVLLDGLMHADMHPWAPFGDDNHLLWVISPELLHLGCLGAGLAGALGLVVRFQLSARRANRLGEGAEFVRPDGGGANGREG